MSADPLAVLRALQFADSGFPSGVFAFSWGLEGALAEGRADPRALRDWVRAELHGRWFRAERIAFAGGFRLRGAALRGWFAEVDTLMPVERARQDSVQAGAALFASARALRIGLDPGAVAAEADGTGHFAVVHGHLLAVAGLDLPAALAASAFGMARGAYSVAVRLGAVGAIAMQRDLAALAPEIAGLVQVPAPDALPAGFAPLSDIALMRPRAGRLFVN